MESDSQKKEPPNKTADKDIFPHSRLRVGADSSADPFPVTFHVV